MTTREELGEILERLEKSKTKSFQLITRKSRGEDFILVDVGDLCVLESDSIRSMYLDLGFRMLDTYIETKILSKVLDFCYDRAKIRFSAVSGTDENLVQQLLEKFDSEFLENHCKSEGDLVKYLLAACELCIKSLMDLTSTAIANRAGEKDANDIFKMFHLKEKITVEEMEKQFEIKSWAFK